MVTILPYESPLGDGLPLLSLYHRTRFIVSLNLIKVVRLGIRSYSAWINYAYWARLRLDYIVTGSVSGHLSPSDFHSSLERYHVYIKLESTYSVLSISMTSLQCTLKTSICYLIIHALSRLPVSVKWSARTDVINLRSFRPHLATQNYRF